VLGSRLRKGIHRTVDRDVIASGDFRSSSQAGCWSGVIATRELRALSGGRIRAFRRFRWRR
jgi:invasion protein IalB